MFIFKTTSCVNLKPLRELFHKAVDNGKLEEWQELTEKAINLKDKHGFSALPKASDQGNMPMVKYLIEKGIVGQKI